MTGRHRAGGQCRHARPVLPQSRWRPGLVRVPRRRGAGRLAVIALASVVFLGLGASLMQTETYRPSSASPDANAPGLVLRLPRAPGLPAIPAAALAHADDGTVLPDASATKSQPPPPTMAPTSPRRSASTKMTATAAPITVTKTATKTVTKTREAPDGRRASTGPCSPGS